MFRPLSLIHFFTIFVVCTCPDTEKEVKVGFKECFYLKCVRFKSDAWELLCLGTELCEQKKYTEAMLAFNDAIATAKRRKEHWDLERAYQGRGKCYAEMGEMKLALSDFENAVSCHEDDTKSRLLLVNARIDTENYDGIVEHVLHLLPEDIVGVANRLCSIEKFDTAMDVYKKLIIKYPRTEYYIARGNCCTKMGHMDEALSDFQSAVDLDKNLSKEQKPGFERVLLCLALFIVGKMNGKELSSLDDVQFRALASKLLEQERFEDAITCLSAAIETYPKNAAFYTKRALLYSKKKDYQSAVEDYKKCFEFDPSNVDCALSLIEAFIKKGDYTEAKQYLEAFESSSDNDILQGLRSKLQTFREKVYSGLEAAKSSPKKV